MKTVNDKYVSILSIIAFIFCNFISRLESSESECKIETRITEDTLFDTICVILTDSYRSEINISCPESMIIGLTDVIVGIRDGCSGNNKNFSCCEYQEADTLIDGRCLRQNLLENVGLYDRIVSSYLKTLSGTTEGIFRYSANVPIPTSLGFNASRSSYIIFKYQCKAAKNFMISADTKGNGTQAIDITTSGILSIQDSVYLGTNHPVLTDDNNNSSALIEYTCLIHTDGQSVDIKIDMLDISFDVSDSSNCNGSLKLRDIKNDVSIVQQECNSWFSPFHINVVECLGILVLLTVPNQSLNETTVWLEMNNIGERNVEIRCGNIQDKLEELLGKEEFYPLSTQDIVLIVIGTISSTILVIFTILGVKIWHRKVRRTSVKITEDMKQKYYNDYDYITVPQSMSTNILEVPNGSERVAYDKAKVEIHAGNGTYETVNEKSEKSRNDHTLNNSEVDENYDHFIANVELKIATESSDYDHI